MTFEDFKTKAFETGYKFSQFTDKGFLGCYAAEIPSKEKYVALYYPNDYNGATLVTGWGKEKRIEFFHSIEESVCNEG